MYKIIFRSEKVVLSDISKITDKVKSNIFYKIDILSKTGPFTSQVKKLNHYNLCDYRLRVGDYRILFDLDSIKKEIVIFRILHRSKLY